VSAASPEGNGGGSIFVPGKGEENNAGAPPPRLVSPLADSLLVLLPPNGGENKEASFSSPFESWLHVIYLLAEVTLVLLLSLLLELLLWW
jgi:hypothetical protein